MATAFVTGGSGFIGGKLIERLRADGHSVGALARSDDAADRIRARGGEPARGELADVQAIRAGAEGSEWAFLAHTAAARPTTADQVRVLGLLPGMHDQDRKGAH